MYVQPNLKHNHIMYSVHNIMYIALQAQVTHSQGFDVHVHVYIYSITFL